MQIFSSRFVHWGISFKKWHRRQEQSQSRDLLNPMDIHFLFMRQNEHLSIGYYLFSSSYIHDLNYIHCKWSFDLVTEQNDFLKKHTLTLHFGLWKNTVLLIFFWEWWTIFHSCCCHLGDDVILLIFSVCWRSVGSNRKSQSGVSNVVRIPN